MALGVSVFENKKDIEEKFDDKKFMGKLFILLREKKEFNLYTLINEYKSIKKIGDIIELGFLSKSTVDAVNSRKDDLFNLINQNLLAVFIDKSIDKTQKLIDDLSLEFNTKLVIK